MPGEKTLKPCPFCGGTKFRFSNGIYAASHAHSVKCTECGARSGFYILRDNAIKGWNRRTSEGNDNGRRIQD
jgi:Lar family restriction alleviation protein